MQELPEGYGPSKILNYFDHERDISIKDSEYYK